MLPSSRYDSLLQYYSWRTNLPWEIIKKQMMAESSGNPKATSQVGARGLLQLMPQTADWIAGQIGPIDPLNPEDSIKAGTWYDAWLLSRINSMLQSLGEAAQDDRHRFMLTSYNGGLGYTLATLKGIQTYDWPTFSEAFRKVVFKGKRPDHRQALGYAEKILPPKPVSG